MADTNCPPPATTEEGKQIIPKCIEIHDGSFEYTNTKEIPQRSIQSATVRFSPSGGTGLLDEIKITGPDGIEFHATDLPVKDGTDLIQAAGYSAANLKGGMTTYEAKGSHFDPSSPIKFYVDLIAH